jgi:hypothetical protein
MRTSTRPVAAAADVRAVAKRRSAVGLALSLPRTRTLECKSTIDQSATFIYTPELFSCFLNVDDSYTVIEMAMSSYKQIVEQRGTGLGSCR